MVLFAIVFLEIIVGIIGLSFFYHKVITSKEESKSAKIAKIDQSKLIKDQVEELKYYYELKPHEEMVDRVFWLDQEIVHTINGDGLNDSFDYEQEKPAGTFRIITLGDSFTYGQNVDTNKIWSEVLEKSFLGQSFSCQIDKVEVINLGMPGFDVQEIVKRFERIGQKYHPDMVIWLESGSGFVRFNEIMQPNISSCLGGGLSQLDSLNKADVDKVDKCWVDAYEKVMADYPLEDRAQMMEKEFDQLFILSGQAKVIFYYYDYYWSERGYDYMSVIDHWRLRYPDAEFVTEIDFSSQLEKYKQVDGHPNIAGHEVIARKIHDHLSENNFLCKKNE